MRSKIFRVSSRSKIKLSEYKLIWYQEIRFCIQIPELLEFFFGVAYIQRNLQKATETSSA